MEYKAVISAAAILNSGELVLLSSEFDRKPLPLCLAAEASGQQRVLKDKSSQLAACKDTRSWRSQCLALSGAVVRERATQGCN